MRVAKKQKKLKVADAVETVLPDHTLFEAIKGFGNGLKGDSQDVGNAGGISKVGQAVLPDKTVSRTVTGTGKGLKQDIDEILGKKKKHKETKLL
tara:strand:- start:2795 stop:3076 length:282 start_codon:yes stop_codon:yes gene_type:complete